MIKTVDESLDGARLDTASAELFDITRASAVKCIENGNITVNGEASEKKYRLKSGDTVSYEAPEAVEDKVVPEDIPIEIVYEDEYLAVVNKPKGMVVHPAPGNYTGTLVSALLYKMKGRLSSINGVIRPGIVHRIDKDTSGLLIIAKTDEAHVGLAEQIKEHSFLREYEGVAVGKLKESSGVIDKPIGRNEKDRKKMAVTLKNSKNAVTEYEVLGEAVGFSYVKFRLKTGRTHQIRVHMASLGHPLMGDTVYGAGKTKFEISNEMLLCGQCLHARRIGFIHPITKQELYFESPLPDYFVSVLHKLGLDPSEEI